jgi:thiamine biosynthesis lipoprotein
MSAPFKTVALARHAMATRFEIVLHGENEVALRAAAEEALDEIQRLEAQLSLYEPASDISRINARAAAGPVRVEPRLFRLLQHAELLSRETEGAFDITVAPLMRCWGFLRGGGRLPEPDSLADARNKVGMHHVILNQDDFTVRFARDGVMLDLGSIGKGYALERAAELLLDAGVTRALLHGGTSTVHAIGAPPDAEAWKVAVPHPAFAAASAGLHSTHPNLDPTQTDLLAVVPLKDEAMSVSAVWGKVFETNGRVYGHVIDPRKGEPVEAGLLAAAVLSSATETDAFSTALLTLGPAGQQQIRRLREGMRTLLVSRSEEAGGIKVETCGIKVLGNHT